MNCSQESDQTKNSQEKLRHIWVKNKYGSIDSCERCKLSRKYLLKKVDTKTISERFLNESEIGINNITEDEINKQFPCLTEDEKAVWDIII